MSSAAGKLVHLECARGVASVIVIFNHFCVGFLPVLKTSVTKGGLLYTPAYFLINGGGAVTFFFLLSGFVLTQEFFANPAANVLARSVIKRLPRLMLPVSVTIFAGLAILLFGGAPHRAAAAISQSAWLASFGNANFPPGFEPGLTSALQRCLTVFLFANNAQYNSNLWTMRDEFAGSLLVFAVSALFLVPRLRGPALMIPLHLGLIVAAFFLHIAFVAFLVGSGLAYLIVVQRLRLQFSGPTTALLLLGAVMGFSTDGLPVVRSLPAVAGSLLLMLALLGNDGLARRLSGPIGRWLGELSFPLYLVHTLVILSLGSALFVKLAAVGLGPGAVLIITFAAVLLASLLFSLPLVALERWWVPWLNGFVKQQLARVTAPLQRLT